MNRHLNTFDGGMKQDLDNQTAAKNTYLYSLNGKVIFNVEQGTYSWENAKGNKRVFTLLVEYNRTPVPKYKPIGFCELNGKLIVLSTNNTFSEIGFVTQDQYGTYLYRTMFNDKFDPYSQKLRFNTRHQIIVEGVVESESIERIYFNDDNNEPRVFNISYAKDSNWYSANIDHSPTYTDLAYSVHGISQMCDLTWGLMKYVRTIQGQGQLTAGRRQYAYRYIHKTGYASAWSQPCNFINLVSDAVDGTNWTNYQMGASGAQTNKAIELEIKYLDTRFQEIEVACILWETDVAVKDVTIFNRSNIPNTGTITILHNYNKGSLITIDEITQRYLSIEHAKTQTSVENCYLLANLKLRKNLAIDTSLISIAPKLRKMLSDELQTVNTTPLTHQTDKDTAITKQLFSGHDEVYQIKNEYVNYKGTQWAHLFTGEFRDEIKPYAIVVFDRKGQPCFAQHITDFKSPSQYGIQAQDIRESGTTTTNFGSQGDYVLTDSSLGSTDVIIDGAGGTPIIQGDNTVIKILGATLSGIDLTDILYDEYGDLQVSGFSIVKADRVKSIIAQGILMNTVRDSSQDWKEVRPLPTMFNWLGGDNAGGLPDMFGISTPITNSEIGEGQDGERLLLKQSVFTFENPDYLFDQTIFGNSISGDSVELIGICGISFKQPDYIQELGTGGHGHIYNKYYYTRYLDNDTTIDNNLDGNFTQTSLPLYQTNEKVEKLFGSARIIDAFSEDYKWREYAGIRNYQHLAPTDEPLSAKAHKNTVLLVLPKQGNIQSTSLRQQDPSATDGEYNHSLYYLANYKRSIGSYTINKSILENRTYNNIGHFIPINEQIITEATQIDGRVVFNDVEVWGGDCYADFFAYCRLEPLYALPGYEHVGDCGHYASSTYPDYAIGMVFPVESAINFTLRKGDEYAKVATRPFATKCGNSNEFPQGIFWQDENTNKPEECLANKVLLAKDIVNVYNPKSPRFIEEYDYPTMEVYSTQKYYGEFYDSFRKIKVNSFQFAEGKYGEITQIERLFNQVYMIQKNAFGRIRFRDREMVNGSEGNIAVGAGTGFTGHDYISTMFGTQHQWGVLNNTKSIYFPDAEKGKLIKFSQAGIDVVSDRAGMHQYFSEKLKKYWKIKDASAGQVLAISEEYSTYDNPCQVGGIHCIYDNKNLSVIYTFTNLLQCNAEGVISTIEGLKETIEYSEVDDTFKSFYSFTPDFYCKFKMNFFSIASDFRRENEFYVHDEDFRAKYYENVFDSILKFAVNPNFPYSKVFDNNRLNINREAVPILKQIALQTSSQVAQTINLNDNLTDSRPKYREGYMVFPLREKNSGERLRGKFITLEYLIQNSLLPNDNLMVRITDNEVQYRISQRT